MTWIPASWPPDADRTVLISTTSGDEPVWLGFYDGSTGWWTVEMERVEVSGWMDLPEPMPGKKPTRKSGKPNVQVEGPAGSATSPKPTESPL